MPEPITAEHIRECLSVRWPDAEYLSIDEAPEESDRGGRKLDRLVVSLWRSRGLRLDGIEIKVSRADWLRELKDVSKADWWWRHVDRFWVAVPHVLVPEIREELPPTWGLLSCPEKVGKPSVVVQAPVHDREPLSWESTVGLMRAAADAGVNAIYRAELRGRDAGRVEGRAQAEVQTTDVHLAAQLEHLRKVVSDFEAASGLDIRKSHAHAERLGEAVRVLMHEYHNPGWALEAGTRVAESIRSSAKTMSLQAANIEKVAKEITRVCTPAEAPTA